MAKVRIFVSKHCSSCQLIKDMVKNSQISEEDVEIIDIENDEGFPYIEEYHLSGVPSAYKEKEKCEMKIDEDSKILHIICSTQNIKEAPLSSGEDQPSPA